MLHRVAVFAFVAAVAVAGVAGRPSTVLAAGCPTVPVSVGDLVALQRPPGPLATAFALGVTPINERGLACFGRRELTISAFVNQPDGIGGVSAFAIKPDWIVAGSLIVFGSSREVAPGFGDGPFFFVSTRPSAGDLQRRYARHWVTIRGHFDDRAAAGCTASGPSGATPTKAQAIAICRTMFVLTSISSTAVPDTSTSTAKAELVRDDRSAVPWLAGFLALVLAMIVLTARRRSGAVSGASDPG